MQAPTTRWMTVHSCLLFVVLGLAIASRVEGAQFDKRQDLSYTFSVLTSGGYIQAFPNNNSLQTLNPYYYSLPGSSYTMIAASNSPRSMGFIATTSQQVYYLADRSSFQPSLDVGPLGRILTIGAIPAPQNASFGLVAVIRAGTMFNLTFFTSADGGKTWNQQGTFAQVPRAPAFCYLSFSSATEAIMVADNLVFATKDAASWWMVNAWTDKEIAATAASSVPYTQFTVVAGAFNLTGQPLALYTMDQGKSWTSALLPASATGIAATSPSEWVICSNDVLYRTTDAGQTWSKLFISPQANTTWLDVAVTYPDIVMATGQIRTPRANQTFVAVHLFDWVTKVFDTERLWFKVVPGSPQTRT